MSNMDKSLFPINLRSSECWLLPSTVSNTSSNNENSLTHIYPLSFFNSSHSFSFWFFLPYQCELTIEISNMNVNGHIVFLNGNKNYCFDNENNLSINDRWIHIVLTKTDSQSNYQTWINGKYASKFDQYYKSLIKMEQSSNFYNYVILRKSYINSLRSSSNIRIADFNAFKRYLTNLEIQAIYQQQTSIKQIKFGTYINNNKIRNINVD
ncbi:unnamed protein product [Rotaria sp. Silwood1]|nr:unnamed protein product [Rotaria sp. Silwood1]CAF5019339.1 unnamed protein product [Rotaria sp. Silwood1]